MHKSHGFLDFVGLLILAAILIPVAALVVSYITIHSYHKYVLPNSGEVAAELTKSPRVAIVFGSGLHSQDGTPRPVLAARLDATLDLYQEGTVDTILLTGHAETNYDEPQAMRDYLLDRGVPAQVMVMDQVGSNTFASCYNAKQVYDVDKAVLVTQTSHIDRALYLCRSQKIEAYGYAAEPASSQAEQFFQQVREAGSNVRAVFDVLTKGQMRYN